MSEMVNVLPGFQIAASGACAIPDKRLKGDDRLVLNAMQGELEAFNELVLIYQDQVYRQAYWMLGEQEAAEDAAQETFLRAYTKIHTYAGPSFRAWILRITTNYCIDQIRRQKSRPFFPLHLLTQKPEVEDNGEELDWLADAQPSPEKQVEAAELSALVYQSLLQLPLEYRIPLILVDIQEMNYQAAAEILALPLNTFKSRLLRARARLAEVIRRVL